MEALKAQFPATNFTLLAVVLALPLIGAFVNGVFGKRLGRGDLKIGDDVLQPLGLGINHQIAVLENGAVAGDDPLRRRDRAREANQAVDGAGTRGLSGRSRQSSGAKEE